MHDFVAFDLAIRVDQDDTILVTLYLVILN